MQQATVPNGNKLASAIKRQASTAALRRYAASLPLYTVTRDLPDGQYEVTSAGANFYTLPGEATPSEVNVSDEQFAMLVTAFKEQLGERITSVRARRDSARLTVSSVMPR